MKIALFDFLKKISITAFIMAGLLLLTILFIPQINLSYPYLFIVLFFYLSGLLFHYLILKLSLKNIKHFTNYFMGSVLIKLILYSAIIIWFLFNYIAQAKIFVAVFFANYLVFTILEVITLQKFVRSIK